MIDPIATHFLLRLFLAASLWWYRIYEEERGCWRNVVAPHDGSRFWMNEGWGKGRCRSEMREADRIYVERRARCNEARDFARGGGSSISGWCSRWKKKDGVLPLFSSQMRIHPTQSRAFIQAVCPTTRRENISSLSRSELRAKTWNVSFFF